MVSQLPGVSLDVGSIAGIGLIATTPAAHEQVSGLDGCGRMICQHVKKGTVAADLSGEANADEVGAKLAAGHGEGVLCPGEAPAAAAAADHLPSQVRPQARQSQAAHHNVPHHQHCPVCDCRLRQMHLQLLS